MVKKDPLLHQPEPITLLLPVIENNLKKINISASRDEIIKRFYNNAKRVAVISGSQDHPAHLYDDKLIYLLMQNIWQNKGLPFSFKIPTLCDGVAQGHYGMQFSLLSRDLTTQMVTSQILAHHYDAGIFISGCDKNPAGFLGAAILTDQMFQKFFNKNFYSIFLNTPVMKDVFLPAGIKKILPENNKIKYLFKEKMRCNVYAKYFKVLNELEKEKKINKRKKEVILQQLSLYACPTGGTCPFMGTGNTSKFILYALGIVPDEYFLPLIANYCDRKKAGKAVKLLFGLNDKNLSPNNLIRKNFKNAVKVLGAINGSLNWTLHLKYLADLLNLKSFEIDIIKEVNNIPVLYKDDSSVYDMAKKETQFKMIKFLQDKNLLKEQLTINGHWSDRLKKRTLFSFKINEKSKYLQFSGNLFNSVIIKVNNEEFSKLKLYHNKIFISFVYDSEDKLINHIMNKKIKSSVILSKNVDKLNKYNALDELFAVFLLGQGYTSKGMPEMYYPSEYINNDSYLKGRTILITDGRYSGATYGYSFGYMEPEFYNSKQLSNLNNGDLILFDFKNKKINLLDKDKFFKFGKVVLKKNFNKGIIKKISVNSPVQLLRDKFKK